MASDDMSFPELVVGATPAQICSILGITPYQSLTSSNGVLSEFHCFPRLPLELRRKIWNTHLKQQQLSRIIEIVLDATHFVDNHRGYKATMQSSRVPPALRNPICREAREEALRTYQLWRLDNQPDGHNAPLRLIYFDPSIDTIYFGHRTCFGTMCFFVDNLVRANKQLSRVAMSLFFDPKVWCGTVQHRPFCSYSVSQFGRSSRFESEAARFLHPLHGMHIDKLPSLRTGWPGLKEVIFAHRSIHTTKERVEQIDENVTFHPITYRIPWDNLESLDDRDVRKILKSKNQIHVFIASLLTRTRPGYKEAAETDAIYYGMTDDQWKQWSFRHVAKE
ncbi:hypothetical protein SBOR_4321 [Sclerotinia borealis F-4128]|uniref:2EXR domain-containing protein n=1 Tax=Sclerotinia borealis (strain F-4128) TaxID=1432307 RepID=W9CKZ7_SCLBF|nr:hypothetical protein SBOR_4321 [Sclerotinia borealis F-4128]